MDLEMPFAIKVKGRDSQTAAETMQPLPTKHMIQLKMIYLFEKWVTPHTQQQLSRNI